MAYTTLDRLLDEGEVESCRGCGALVQSFMLANHKRFCGAFQNLWQEEYDAQLGADIDPTILSESPSNSKLEQAKKLLENFKKER